MIFVLKIAICDDDNNICTQIEKIIMNYVKQNLVNFEIEIFNEGKKLLDSISKGNKFDFLDIDLITVTGIEIAGKIRNNYLLLHNELYNFLSVYAIYWNIWSS